MTAKAAATQTRHRIIRWIKKNTDIDGRLDARAAVQWIRQMDERQNKRKGGI